MENAVKYDYKWVTESKIHTKTTADDIYGLLGDSSLEADSYWLQSIWL